MSNRRLHLHTIKVLRNYRHLPARTYDFIVGRVTSALVIITNQLNTFAMVLLRCHQSVRGKGGGRCVLSCTPRWCFSVAFRARFISMHLSRPLSFPFSRAGDTLLSLNPDGLSRWADLYRYNYISPDRYEDVL